MKTSLLIAAIAAALVATSGAASAGGAYKRHKAYKHHAGTHHANRHHVRRHRAARHHGRRHIRHHIRPAIRHTGIRYSAPRAQSYVYGSYTKNIIVKQTRYVAVPVRYKLIATQVMVSPARRIWTCSTDRYGQLIGCWRNKPAQYGTRYRTVMTRPASVYYSVIPAQYRTVTRSVRVH